MKLTRKQVKSIITWMPEIMCCWGNIYCDWCEPYLAETSLTSRKAFSMIIDKLTESDLLYEGWKGLYEGWEGSDGRPLYHFRIVRAGDTSHGHGPTNAEALIDALIKYLREKE